MTDQPTHTCHLLDLQVSDDGTELVCPHGSRVPIDGGEVVIDGQTYRLHRAEPTTTPAGRTRPAPTTDRKVTGL